MKKLNKFCLFLILLILPIDVLACPHVDESGNLHLQTYNSDYTKVTMIYPRENYLYSKEVYMDIEGINMIPYEDNILSEEFGFSIYQEITSYITFYWILDESLTYTDFDEIDAEITVENYDSLLVSGDNYTINAGLTNTYDEGIKYLNDNTFQIYYDIVVENLQEDEDYQSLISEYEMNLLNEEIFSIEADFMVVEVDGYLYDTEYKTINNLYDDITVNIYSEEYNENAVIINLNEISNDNFIEVSYSDSYYSFTTDKTGIYVLVEYLEISEEEEFLEELPEEEDEDVIIYDEVEEAESDSVNYIAYIIGGSLALVLLISIVGFVIIKKNNK